jgi:hypothetical protein
MKRSAIKNAVGPVVLLATVSMLGWGCDILDEGTPENARVILEGGSGEEVEMVTSNDFQIVTSDDGENREVSFFSADTTFVTPSFNQKYSLGSGVRFYIEVSSDEPLAQPVTLRVLIDGERRYNAASTLGDQEMEFLYTFR